MSKTPSAWLCGERDRRFCRIATELTARVACPGLSYILHPKCWTSGIIIIYNYKYDTVYYGIIIPMMQTLCSEWLNICGHAREHIYIYIYYIYIIYILYILYIYVVSEWFRNLLPRVPRLLQGASCHCCCLPRTALWHWPWDFHSHPSWTSSFSLPGIPYP